MPGSGRVLEDVSGGPALFGLQNDSRLCAQTSLRCIHVHVPESNHELVQIARSSKVGRDQVQTLVLCLLQLAVLSGAHCRQWASLVMTVLQQRVPVFPNKLLLCSEVFNKKHFAL